MTKNSQALNILADTDNEDVAWEIAKHDEGLRIDVTKDQWISYARKWNIDNISTEKAYAQYRNQ